MNIQKVTDASFRKYGKIVENIDFTGLVQALNEKTPSPEDVVYEPSVEALEELPVYDELCTKAASVMLNAVLKCDASGI